MAKRATAKRSGDDSSPNKADDSSALPSAPAIDTPSSGSSEPLVDEVAAAQSSVGFPAQPPSSPPDQVTQPENTTGLIDPPAEEAPQADTNQPTDSAPPDDPATAGEGKAAEPNPAIELAKRHKVAAGKPRDGLPRYITPPPFDVFAKKKAK